MNAAHSRVTHWGCVALASAVALLASPLANSASASSMVECQHPVMTGVEVYKLHHITSRSACPVALALFRWETTAAVSVCSTAVTGSATPIYGCITSTVGISR
jgi:hypothetical protein